MKTIKLIFYWGQVIFSLMIIAYMGVFQLVRCFLQHSDNFYKLCFAAIIYVGIYFMLLPSIAELRQAQKQ